MADTKALATVQPMVLQSFDERWRMAKIMSESGLAVSGKDVWTPQQCFMLGLKAEADMIPFVEALDHYDIIMGKPARKSISMQAKFEAAGGTIKIIQNDSDACILELIGPDGKVTPSSWTYEDAKEYVVYERGQQIPICEKANWKGRKKRQTMLYWRAISEGCKKALPSAFINCYTADELEDMATESTPIEATGTSTSIDESLNGDAAFAVEGEVMASKEQIKELAKLCGSGQMAVKAIRTAYGQDKDGKNLTYNEAQKLIERLSEQGEADGEEAPRPILAKVREAMEHAPGKIRKQLGGEDFASYSDDALEGVLRLINEAADEEAQ